MQLQSNMLESVYICKMRDLVQQGLNGSNDLHNNNLSTEDRIKSINNTIGWE